MPVTERPLNRLYQVGARSVSNAELIATLLQTQDVLDLAHELLQAVDGQIHRLPTLTRPQLKRLRGIGDGQAARLQAALELGRRVLTDEISDRPRVASQKDGRLPHRYYYIVTPAILNVPVHEDNRSNLR